MTFRFLGLAPAIALLAVGAAHAQPNVPTGGGGSMAYPESLSSGQTRIPAPTARDTGNMAYPPSPGGVTQAAPTGRDVGSMAENRGSGGTTTTPAPVPHRTLVAAVAKKSAAPAAARVAPPTAQDLAAARALETAPSATPVPYTDFAAPAPVRTRRVAPVHKAAVKKAATPAPTPAPAAPATPATPPAK